jgi:hypothetical protein
MSSETLMNRESCEGNFDRISNLKSARVRVPQNEGDGPMEVFPSSLSEHRQRAFSAHLELSIWQSDVAVPLISEF